MLFPKKISTFAPLKRREIRDGFGRMAEWSNAAVLKTVDLHGSGGSNPSSSAKKIRVAIATLIFIICYPLLGDVDLVDLGLLAGGTGEEVLGCDDGGAFVTLDLLYPELHG